MDVPIFPLTRLPNVAVLHTLRAMNSVQLIGYSLITKRTKKQVMALFWKVKIIFVNVHNGVQIGFGNHLACLFYQEETLHAIENGLQHQRRYFTKPQSIMIRHQEIVVQWPLGSLEMTEWMDHFHSIFHHPRIDCMRVLYYQFSVEDLKATFKNLNRLHIADTENVEKAWDLLNGFHPLKQLELYLEHFPGHKTPNSILIQNFDLLGILGMGIESRMTLEEMLMINSKAITIHFMGITEKQLNRFLKLWQKGSNPNLEQLFIYRHSLDLILNEQEVLRGIEGTEQVEAKYFRFACIEVTEKVENGFEIDGFNGKKATIRVRENDEICAFQMFIWSLQDVLTEENL